MKRTFDILGSATGLLLLFPMLVIIGVLVKLSDGGPIFFRQVRVGRGGRFFRLWKFRTMVPDADRLGGALTVGRDPRITSVGRWLRRWKMDELPQLLNVLRGEMSFVGPRPEVPHYVTFYSEEQRRVLELTPGVTDPASIRFRAESEMLAQAENAERVYLEVIMPEKLRMNLAYAREATLWRDLLTICKTLGALVLPKAGGAMP